LRNTLTDMAFEFRSKYSGTFLFHGFLFSRLLFFPFEKNMVSLPCICLIFGFGWAHGAFTCVIPFGLLMLETTSERVLWQS